MRAILLGAFALTACTTGDGAGSESSATETDPSTPADPAPSGSDPGADTPSASAPASSSPASNSESPDPAAPSPEPSPLPTDVAPSPEPEESGEDGNPGTAGSAGSGGSAATGTGGEAPTSGGAESNGGSDGGANNSSGTGGDAPVGGAGGAPPAPDDMSMSFFVTSRGMGGGGNLGGLEGADAFCGELAAAVDPALGAATWRAYLSTSTVDARDRIGEGPWRNLDLVIVANDVEELHQQEAGEALDATWPPMDTSIALDENGVALENEVHDVLTGSNPDGTALSDATCADWTSNSADDQGQVGHTNRVGGGRPPYFNSTHAVGCAEGTENYQDGTVTQGGGRGSFYCFRVD